MTALLSLQESSGPAAAAAAEALQVVLSEAACQYPEPAPQQDVTEKIEYSDWSLDSEKKF